MHDEMGDLPDLTLPHPSVRAELEQVAVTVAQEAARLIVDDRPRALGVDLTKSSPTDVVTVMDQRAQDLLSDRLAVLCPDDGLFGEEQGGRAGTSGITWVVDPIDGTVNYLYGIPMYAVSVAAVVGDTSRPGCWRPFAGAVADPERREVFHAHTGGGAWRRRGASPPVPVRVSDCTDLGQALAGTGFGYDAARRAAQARTLVEVLPQVRDIRRGGSAAVDLCLFARGALDCIYETGLNPWDIAAGWVVAAEAGGLVGGMGDLGPTRRLTWLCTPGLAPAFPDLVRSATGRHLADVPD